MTLYLFYNIYYISPDFFYLFLFPFFIIFISVCFYIFHFFFYDDDSFLMSSDSIIIFYLKFFDLNFIYIKLHYNIYYKIFIIYFTYIEIL